MGLPGPSGLRLAVIPGGLELTELFETTADVFDLESVLGQYPGGIVGALTYKAIGPDFLIPGKLVQPTPELIQGQVNA